MAARGTLRAARAVVAPRAVLNDWRAGAEAVEVEKQPIDLRRARGALREAIMK